MPNGGWLESSRYWVCEVLCGRATLRGKFKGNLNSGSWPKFDISLEKQMHSNVFGQVLFNSVISLLVRVVTGQVNWEQHVLPERVAVIKPLGRVESWR